MYMYGHCYYVDIYNNGLEITFAEVVILYYIYEKHILIIREHSSHDSALIVFVFVSSISSFIMIILHFFLSVSRA